MRRGVSGAIAVLLIAVVAAPNWPAPNIVNAQVKDFTSRNVEVARYDLAVTGPDPCTDDPLPFSNGSWTLTAKEGKAKPDTLSGNGILRNAVEDFGPPTDYADHRFYEVWIIKDTAAFPNGSDCQIDGPFATFFTNKRGNSTNAKSIVDKKLDDTNPPVASKFSKVDVDGFFAFGIFLKDLDVLGTGVEVNFATRLSALGTFDNLVQVPNLDLLGFDLGGSRNKPLNGVAPQ